MKAEERRKKILDYLYNQSEPQSGSTLAGLFNVTRQVIVQDMAILRAERNNIIATAQGYMMLPGTKSFSKNVVCSHTKEQLKDELMTFVEYGCKVVDVSVEHPIYGELKGNLMLSSVKDVEAFLEKINSNNAMLLSQLTHGIHIHTIEAENEDSIEKAKDVLRKKGILVE